MQVMVQDLVQALHHDTSHEELRVGHGDAIPHAEMMLVLGTLVDVGRNAVGAAVAHRTQKAWASW